MSGWVWVRWSISCMEGDKGTGRAARAEGAAGRGRCEGVAEALGGTGSGEVGAKKRRAAGGGRVKLAEGWRWRGVRTLVDGASPRMRPPWASFLLGQVTRDARSCRAPGGI